MASSCMVHQLGFSAYSHSDVLWIGESIVWQNYLLFLLYILFLKKYMMIIFNFLKHFLGVNRGRECPFILPFFPFIRIHLFLIQKKSKILLPFLSLLCCCYRQRNTKKKKCDSYCFSNYSCWPYDWALLTKSFLVSCINLHSAQVCPKPFMCPHKTDIFAMS